MDIERRAFAIEFRVEGDEKPKIRGYAAVFNKMSDLLGGFREKIAPGAFKRTLKQADVRALFNHDPDNVLGRTKNETLSLREDDKGLWMEIEPPDTAQARDVMTLIQRGDVDQASFAFRVIKDTWTNQGDGETPIRTLDEVQLFDVSAVTYPAYPQTSVDVRARMTEDGQFTVLKTYPDVESHSEPDPQSHSPDPAASHSGDPVEHSEPDPEEVHSETTPYIPRDINVLVKEWRLEVEAGRS